MNRFQSDVSNFFRNITWLVMMKCDEKYTRVCTAVGYEMRYEDMRCNKYLIEIDYCWAASSQLFSTFKLD